MSNNNAKRIEKEAQKDACIFMSVVLQSLVNEQIKAKQLKCGVGDYIYQAVKDQAIHKGWLD